MEKRFHWPPPPSTPEEAPWREIEALINGMGIVTSKLDTVLVALEALLLALGAPAAAAVGAAVSGAPSVVSLLLTGPLTEIFRRSFSQLAAADISEKIDFTKGLTALIKVESTLDQVVNLQPVGNIVDAPDTSTNIGLPIPLPAQGNTTIVISQATWHPFVWVRVTPVVAPIQGNLVISYVIHG